MGKTIYIVGIAMCFCFQLFSNGRANYLSETDTVWVEINTHQEKYFEHIVRPKQTLYSLSKFYGIDMLEIFDQNPYLKEKVLGVHDTVRVAIHNSLIKTVRPVDVSNYVPVYYRVQKKDNLFRIARRYFDLPVKTLMQHNQLSNYNLDINQALLVGWIHLDGAHHGTPSEQIAEPAQEIVSYEIKYEVDKILASQPEDEPKIEPRPLPLSEADETVAEPTAIKNEIDALQSSFEKESVKLEYREERGVAHWSKGIKYKTDLYVLHPSAPVGSTVQVTNPLINRSIYAKVIAPLPEGMYPGKSQSHSLTGGGQPFRSHRRTFFCKS